MIFYNLFICLLSFGLKVFSWFNEKAKKGVDGRKESLKIVQEKLKNQKVIWMHSASLGEYEQGLPVLEKLKNEYPDYKILVTFFSPSGYENVIKKQNIADAVCYLLFDEEWKINQFISLFDTKIFFTIKYDFWYHLLKGLHKQGVKTFVVSALFYEKQVFFKPWGKWFVRNLKENIEWFFHQTSYSMQLAKEIGLVKSSVSGDTRFDRVRQIREQNIFIPFIDEFKEDKKLVVFGSSWESEENIAKVIYENTLDIKIIIAPHSMKRVESLKKIFPEALLYSEISSHPSVEIQKSRILIVDSIGLLSKLYSYGDAAVVGGGFHSAGLHNILEAAVFGIPVIFGNHYKKNPEADALISCGGAMSFSDEHSAAAFVLNLIQDKELLSKMSQNAEKFIFSQPNATQIVIRKILELMQK
jgi:3-deoxy-D-manno-octulosonic-acid transferase